MQLLLHRTRLKTAERDSDFPDQNADAALKGSMEHRRSAKERAIHCLPGLCIWRDLPWLLVVVFTWLSLANQP